MHTSASLTEAACGELATDEEEAHKKSHRYYEHAVRDAALSNYHNSMKRYGIEE
jgi:hypothetical protein